MFNFIRNLYSFSVNGIYFKKLNDKTVEVVKGSSKYDDNVEIPSFVNNNGRNFVVTNIGIEAFQDCNDLKSVTIPNSVVSIGNYAFNGCSNLEAVNIPTSVTNIGDEAFSGCLSLKSIAIPKSMATIGWYAFESCKGLASLFSYVENPNKVYLVADVFLDVPTSTCALHVPEGSKKIYEKTDQWKEFTNIVEDVNAENIKQGYKIASV